MPVTIPGVDFPVIAVDMNERGMRALLYRPDAAPQTRLLPDTDSDMLRAIDASFAIDNSVPILAAACETGRPLLAASEKAAPSPAESLPLRHALWSGLLLQAGASGLLLDELFTVDPPESFLRLSAIHRMTKRPVADSFVASLLGIIAAPVIEARNFRQGILAVKAGADSIQAALVFQNRLFGVYERPWVANEAADLPGLLRELESFRLGWLPPEIAAASGGAVVVCPNLPPEAEGFKPLYVTGKEAQALQANGQMVSINDDPAMTGCWGLVHAFGRLRSVRP